MQSVQDDSSLLDVNAMSAIPEDPEHHPYTKVSDSLSTYIADFSVKILKILTTRTGR